MSDEILIIGEILFDHFPSYRVMGGAPFNFAFHLKKFGLPVRFISRVGEDDSGREVIDFLEENGFDTQDIQIDAVKQTGRVQVELDKAGIPDFHIIEDAAYDRIEYDGRLKSIITAHPKMIYFGTLIQRTDNGFHTLEKVFTNRPEETISFCDINLRLGCYTRGTVINALRNTDVLKLNDEELDIIGGMLPEDGSGKSLAQQVMEAFGIGAIVLTLGKDGGQWFHNGGMYQSEPADIENFEDTVGAGDAFAAISAMGCLFGWPPQKTIQLANRFAATICTVKGAIPAEDTIYNHFKKEAQT